MEIEKTYRGWILDDQGWRVLFVNRELQTMGINPTWDPWSVHPRRGEVLADMLYNAALAGRGERLREKWRFKK